MANKAVYVKPGGGYDNVFIGQHDAPEPGAGEITVRLRASTVNYHDFLVVTGVLPVTEPRIPMADGAGEVVAVGQGVDEFAVGDSVNSNFCYFWLDGEPSVEGLGKVPGDGIDGFAREKVTAPTNFFTRSPKDWSHAESAGITSGVTAWRVLVGEARIKAGDAVLVEGTSSTSLWALQLAKMNGATVIATSSTDEKLERLQELGADFVINYRKDPSWGETARRVTGGRGVDIVVDMGGASTLEQSILAVRVGGHIALVGVLGGFDASLPLLSMVEKQPHLHGVMVGSRRQQQDLVRAINANGMRPVLDRHFSLDSIVDAFRYQESGRHFGKIIIDI